MEYYSAYGFSVVDIVAVGFSLQLPVGEHAPVVVAVLLVRILFWGLHESCDTHWCGLP